MSKAEWALWRFWVGAQAEKRELPLCVLREQGMTTIHSLDCICKLSSHNLKSVLYTLQHFLEIHVVYAFEETVTVLLTVTSGFHDACQSAQILLLRVRLFRWWQQCNLATWVRKKTDPSFCTCNFWRNEQLLVRNDWRKIRRKGILARASLVRWLLGTWIHVLSKTTLDCRMFGWSYNKTSVTTLFIFY